MNSPKSNFFIDNNNVIYKTTKNSTHLLKVSPWEQGEDRRLFPYEVSDSKLKKISFSSAMKLLNKQFADYENEWTYKGKKYKILKSTFPESTFKDGRSEPYLFPNFYTDSAGVRRGHYDKFYLTWFRGKLYWICGFAYYPQVMLYHFKDIDTRPTYNDFAQWTNVKNCKIIYDEKTTI